MRRALGVVLFLLLATGCAQPAAHGPSAATGDPSPSPPPEPSQQAAPTWTGDGSAVRQTEWDGLPWLALAVGETRQVNVSHAYRLDDHLALLMQGGNLDEVPHLGLGDWLELNNASHETYIPIHDRLGVWANGTRYDLKTTSCTRQTRFTDVEEHWTIACNVTLSRSAWTLPTPVDGTQVVRLAKGAGDVLMAQGQGPGQGTLVRGIGHRVSDAPFLYLWGEYKRPFDGERLQANGGFLRLVGPAGGATLEFAPGGLEAPITYHVPGLEVSVRPVLEAGDGQAFGDYRFEVAWKATSAPPQDGVVVDYGIERP